MRIIAGQWRGRTLVAPPGQATRPTAERLRQAIFDMLVHAPWGGRGLLEGAVVLDLFAGTGALGLEALSRGAASCDFFETDPTALRALRLNVAACEAGGRTRVQAADACVPLAGSVAALVFLDPPYRRNLVVSALTGLARAGRIDGTSVLICEFARDEVLPAFAEILADRVHGAARVVIARGAEPPSSSR